jgi:hypothetical protein
VNRIDRPGGARALLREPLVHFLLLGGVLFGIGILRGENEGASANRIAITPGAVERLIEGFRLTWQRPPTEGEFRGLVEEYLKEEVLYREALEMGLDRDDQIIRRRMRQKLEFLTSDVVEAFEPTEQELQSHLTENADLYRREATVSFLQIYFRQSDDVAADRVRATSVRDRLLADPGLDPRQLGDPFMHPLAQGGLRERDVASAFGAEFAAEVVGLPIGEWSGPVESAFGLHVVRVDVLEPGGLSDLDEVRDAVYRDLVSLRTREAEQAYFEQLLAQYTVTVDWPEGMEAVELPGVIR